MNKPTRKIQFGLVSALAAAALLISGCTSSDSPTEAATPTSPTAEPRLEPYEAARAGAAWLNDQVVENSFIPGPVEARDVGLTINALFAFAAAMEYGLANPVAAWVSDQTVLDSYASDAPSMTYPGRIALAGLAISLEEVQYPADIGAKREQLVERLLARLQDDGRFTDDSDYDDTSSPISQSLAILFLLKADALDDLEADPVDFLVSTACEDGSFPIMLDSPAGCAGAVDSTAYAILALQMFPDQVDTLDKATEWLVEQQNDKGQWEGWEGPSVDSTALGLLALQDLGSGPGNLAVAASWTALAEWQFANGAWPIDDKNPEGDIRATASGTQ
ncbi:MAG: terpene cyclase/mutase family protein, partial [Micrococcales bacterium]|nr:terpene cyclase/mutase family protein [Micrococcales bacterium]